MYNIIKNMQIHSLSKKIAILLVVLFSASSIFAKEPKEPRLEDKLTALKKDARVYRDQGLACQRSGDLESALSFYQKSIQLDPTYVVAYNDLGVIYEAKGQVDRAEETYLRAIATDPTYLNSYTNLALLYEGKRDLHRAEEFWEKRAELGSGDDPWTNKANERAEEISLILSKRPLEDLREKEILRLTERVSKPRTVFTYDDKSMSRKHFSKANEFYNKREYAAAVKEALDAQQYDPTNKEIEQFIEKVQLRALSE